MDQIFFHGDDYESARVCSERTRQDLFVIEDRRSGNPKPRMYVLGSGNVDQFRRSPLWKRMWAARCVYPMYAFTFRPYPAAGLEEAEGE